MRAQRKERDASAPPSASHEEHPEDPHDPGRHGLAIEVAARRSWRWSGTVEPGAELRLTAGFEPLPAASATFDPLPWILGAAGAAVVGLIVALVVADAEAQLDPRTSMVIALP